MLQCFHGQHPSAQPTSPLTCSHSAAHQKLRKPLSSSHCSARPLGQVKGERACAGVLTNPTNRKHACHSLIARDQLIAEGTHALKRRCPAQILQQLLSGTGYKKIIQ